MDDGILVVKSWLMSATEYIATDNTLLQPRVHVDGTSGMAQEPTNFVLLTFAKTKHCYIPFVYVALGAVARVNQVIPYISTMYPWHACLVVIHSSMSPCWTRWRVGAWLMNLLIIFFKFICQ